jgi:histidine triad (HIT) family protein
MKECTFCKIIKGEIPAHVLEETAEVLALMSLQGHPMVITKKHFDDIFNLDERTAASVMQMAVKLANAVRIGLKADGVKIVQNNGSAAGQEVMHYHLHIRQKYSSETHTGIPSEDIDDKTRETIFEKIKTALKDLKVN